MKVFPGSSFLQITQGVATPKQPAQKAADQSDGSFAQTLRGDGNGAPPPARSQPILEMSSGDRPRGDQRRGALIDIKV